MIGPKKLSKIRQELRDKIAGTGDDPLEWLEKQPAVTERQARGSSAEVLRSLKRIIEAKETPKRPAKRKRKKRER